MAEGLGLGSGNVVSTARIFTNQSIAGRGISDSDPWQIKLFAINGFFSVNLKVTGTGAVELSYLLSHDGVTYLPPSSAASIVAGFTSSSGTSGQDIFSFSPEIAPWIKIRAINRSAAASTVVANAWLAMG